MTGRELLQETKDYFLYGECLQEETAESYLKYLKDNWESFDLEQTGTALDAELDSINTNRFNEQLKDLEKKEDYFEGSSFEEFKRGFQEKLQRNTEFSNAQKRQVQMIFNEYVSKFQGTKFKKYADWKT